jgi:enamine deaminase RidA (YjgF/YER057c/UK114 family)
MLTKVLMLLIIGLAFVNPVLGEGARQDSKVVMAPDPDNLKFENEWGYAEAIVAGDTVYLSGVVAGVRPGETDLQASYTRAFERIGVTLKSAGVSWDDVVDILTFHTDLTTQMPAIVAVKNRYIKAPFPTWTAIQVARLIPDNGITEIKIVAKLSSPVSAGKNTPKSSPRPF